MFTYQKLEGGKLVPVESDAAGPVLIVCATPTEAEVRELSDKYGLAPHNVQSALDPDELGRMEFDDDHLAIILKRPCNYSSKDNYLFRVMSTGVFVFKDRMIVVLESQASILEGKNTRLTSLHDVLLRIVNVTINHFMGHLKVINMLSESLEGKISTSVEHKALLNMFTLEKSLVYFVSALNDTASLLGKLRANAGKVGFSPENLELLDDITVDNQQCLTLAQTYSNILSSLMDARASLVGNNLNIMMKNLNALVIAVSVPSFFAGVGGMSEFSMMTGASHWYIAYPLFLLSMVGVGAITYFVVKRLEKH